MNRLAARRLPVIIGMMAKSAKLVSLLKVIKLTKVLLTASTMALSALVYGWAFGPAFGIGLVSMLLIHEMGHVIAMRRVGIPTSAPVFIPFLGAVIFAPPMEDRATEAYVGYGGPLLGSIGALICLAAWAFTGSKLLLLTAFIGIYINLFNMIPMSPLDGGRVAQIIGPYTIYFGMVILALFTVITGEPGMTLVWIISLQEVRWPVWYRPIVCGVMLAAMTLLFYFGYGSQPWPIDIVDVVVGCLVFMMTCATDIHWYKFLVRQQLDPSTARYDPSIVRPYPPARTRYTWLAIYGASVALLWTIMAYIVSQIQLLQHP